MLFTLNLKPGQRHLYASRTFYVMDDDFYNLSIMDAYDDNGEINETPNWNNDGWY